MTGPQALDDRSSTQPGEPTADPTLPSLDVLRAISDELGLQLRGAELSAFRSLMADSLKSYRELLKLKAPGRPIRYPREQVRAPSAEENPLNAWYWRCSIRGAAEGPLLGLRVVVKDNICVAGVPMMNGSRVLEGYLPEEDATVVTRVLDAGAEIVGKGVCEHLSFGGSSFTSDTGPVRNPHDLDRSSGGSTSGPIALLASGEADLALGGDQGGSIRIPSAWCGVYGLKPTYGLVPYTGVSSIEMTQDHVGLAAGTASNLARLLEAVAGEDGLDPRQSKPSVGRYSQDLSAGLKGVRIGVLEEGFGWPNASEPDVDELVRSSALELGRLGAEVQSVSLPMHRLAQHVWRVIAIEGRTAQMFRGRGMGTNWKGHYTLGLLEAYAEGFRRHPDRLSETVKLLVLLGEAMLRRYDGRYYAQAQNSARTVKSAYDDGLDEVDLFILPTAPMKATLLPGPESTVEQRFTRNLEMTLNTTPFNVTGHPALSVPCGLSSGLPVGMMLIGRHFDESTLLRVAHAFEMTGRYPVSEAPPF